MNVLSYILDIVSIDETFMIRLVLFIIVALLILSLIVSYIKERKQNKKVEIQEDINEPFNIFQSNIVTPDEEKKEASQEEPITNTSLEEEPELIQLSDIPIPDELEYTQALWQNDALELQNLTKELENGPKEHKIQMTAYEAEQEEKAIISYDELVQRNSAPLKETDTVPSKEEGQKQKENLYLLEEIQEKVGEENYTHEENFLESLKELKESLT